MPVKRQGQPLAVRFVQVTTSDDAIVEYFLGTNCFVDGVTITARPTAGVPTAAQLQGITRIVGYRGNARDPSQSITLAGQDPAGDGVDVFLDGNVGMTNVSGPQRFGCHYRILKEERFCFEVRRGIATDGSSFDVDIAITPIVTLDAQGNQGYKAV